MATVFDIEIENGDHSHDHEAMEETMDDESIYDDVADVSVF